jgi:hypothetical protein
VYIRTLTISILGLAVLAAPAHATLSFFNGGTSAGTAATEISLFNAAAAALNFPEPLTNFASALTGSPAIYTDPTTGTEFFGFDLSGSVNGVQDGLTGVGTQLQQLNHGGIIEVLGFSSTTLAFAANVQLTSGGLSGTGNYCLEVNVTSFNQGGSCNLTFSPTSLTDVEFIGLVSSIPITSVWIGPVGGLYNSETTAIVNSEIGDQMGTGGGSDTPEAATMAMIGGGLMLLGGARRWRTLTVAPSQ